LFTGNPRVTVIIMMQKIKYEAEQEAVKMVLAQDKEDMEEAGLN